MNLRATINQKWLNRVEIPERSGEFVPLGTPEISDRLVQLCIKKILEPIIDKCFYGNSYGLRLGHSAEHAIVFYYQMVNIFKDLKLSIIKCMLKIETILSNKEIVLSEKGPP